EATQQLEGAGWCPAEVFEPDASPGREAQFTFERARADQRRWAEVLADDSLRGADIVNGWDAHWHSEPRVHDCSATIHRSSKRSTIPRTVPTRSTLASFDRPSEEGVSLIDPRSIFPTSSALSMSKMRTVRSSPRETTRFMSLLRQAAVTRPLCPSKRFSTLPVR